VVTVPFDRHADGTVIEVVGALPPLSLDERLSETIRSQVIDTRFLWVALGFQLWATSADVVITMNYVNNTLDNLNNGQQRPNKPNNIDCNQYSFIDCIVSQISGIYGSRFCV